MSSPFRLPLFVALSAVLSGIPRASAVPVLADPIAPENGAVRVVPRIPVGKTLVLPLLASDSEGKVLDFTVSSSNPKIMARVRTGCPILKIHASYAGDPGATPIPVPAFDGDMEYQLFQDATPITAGNIGGLAQAGYYNNLIFHRVIPGAIIQGGDPAGNGSGVDDKGTPSTADDEFIGLSYTFQHEFRPELIFSGRGQLAMANSNGGYGRGTTFGSFVQLGNFNATNGSQFFATITQTRSLDFKHTIFGQLIRGFDVLDKIAIVPRNASDKPNVGVKMTTVSLVPGKSDATLLLSATAAGTATLTVTARNPDPGVAVAVRRIVVTARRDDTNDPPLLRPIPNLITPVGVAPRLPLRAFDLEHDYLLYGIAAIVYLDQSGRPVRDQFNRLVAKTDLGSVDSATSTLNPIFGIAESFTPHATAGFQDLAVGVAGFNDPLVGVSGGGSNAFAPFDAYRFQVAEIGYGDRAISGEAVPVEGTVAVPLTDVVLGEFRDGDAGGTGADFTAKVQWGDGTAAESSSGTTPKIRIAPSATTPGSFVVKGTHTFAKAGVYTIETVVDGSLGATARTRGQAVVVAAGADFRAAGVTLQNTGAAVNGRALATFSDTTPGVQAADFSARIDWGDGRTSPGQIVAKGAGKFAVLGSHGYRNPAAYSVFAHISKGAPAVEKGTAWSQVTASGFKVPQRLPPFSIAHLIGQISQATDASRNIVPFISTSGGQTRFSVSIVVLNSGDLASKIGSLRFYLSKDQKFNATRVGDQPADIPLTIGPFAEGNLPVLQPGGGLRYDLVRSVAANGAVSDLRLTAPAGQNGASYFILAHLGYSDPLADQLPISKDVTFGRINGIKLNVNSVLVTEASGAAHSRTFRVSLKARPLADVRIPLALSDSTQVDLDTALLIFTRQNWNVPQIVTVTAKDDAIDEVPTTTTDIGVGPAISTDESWDGMSGESVRAFVTDNDPA